MKNYFTIIVLLFSIAIAQAQTGDIRGFVYDKTTGEPMIYTNVYLSGTSIGATTDEDGLYSIPKVPVGNYTLMCTFVGMDTFQINISITAGKIIQQNIFLKESTIKLDEVNISAKKEEKKTEVQISTIKISPKQIKAIPSIGGEADLAQYLQVLPGVIFTGDQGGQLYIRGGSPIQNKVMLDGMTIYNPFHSIGLFSIFETDIIRNVNVITGGFNAEYGQRISAVVDVTTRDGNKKELAGKISASPFMGRLMLEGPISRLKEDGGGSSSFLFTGKYSYIDKSSKVIYPWLDTINGIPFSFADFYGKISMNSGNGSKLSFFGFNFNDKVNYPAADYKWNSFGAGTNFVMVLEGSKTIIKGLINYSNYVSQFSELNKKSRNSSIGGFNMGLNFIYFFPKSELNYGFNINGFKTTFEFFNDYNLKIDQNQNTTEIGGYISYRLSTKRLVIEPGLRMDYYASLQEISPEPRLGIKVNITDWLRFKAGTGVFAQNFISTKSDRDVVNLFNGFLSAPDENLTNINGNLSKTKLQRAFHIITGIEFDVTDDIECTIEPYYKGFIQLLNLNRMKQLPSDPNYMIETGTAYGIDFSLKYDYRNYYLWMVYSSGYNKRNDGTQIYPPHYDRRHNVNIIGTYKFGKHQNWEASVRWNLGSGFPFTKTQGFYEYFDFADGINTDPYTTNGQLGIIYDIKLNGGRLPYYHRLDLSLSKSTELSKDITLEMIAGVTNVYNRKNIFYFDRVNYTRVNQLPIIPAISASLTF